MLCHREGGKTGLQIFPCHRVRAKMSPCPCPWHGIWTDHTPVPQACASMGLATCRHARIRGQHRILGMYRHPTLTCSSFFHFSLLALISSDIRVNASSSTILNCDRPVPWTLGESLQPVIALDSAGSVTGKISKNQLNCVKTQRLNLL